MNDAHQSAPSPVDQRNRLRDLINGYAWTQIIHAATRLRLADLLAGGPLSAPELAARSGADLGLLRRLLNGLVAIGVVTVEGEDRYRLSAVGDGLRKDVPGFLARFALLSGDDYYRAWLGFDPQKEDGVTPFARVFGAPVFDWYGLNPESGARFNRRMAERIAVYAPAAAAASDLSEARRIVDVGGGHGVLLAAFLSRWPQPQGVLFDLPDAAAGGEQRLIADGLSQRVEIVAGDFFTDVTAGGDIYLLSQILHDWNDDQCLVILKNIRRAIVPVGRLLIIEMLMPEPVTGPDPAIDLDLLMMVLTGGRERTAAEYERLLVDSGFSLKQVYQQIAPGGISLLDARPI